jgi:hypothetical protein
VSLEQVYSSLLALLEEAEHSQPRPLAERVAVMTANKQVKRGQFKSGSWWAKGWESLREENMESLEAMEANAKCQ